MKSNEFPQFVYVFPLVEPPPPVWDTMPRERKFQITERLEDTIKLNYSGGYVAKYLLIDIGEPKISFNPIEDLD